MDQTRTRFEDDLRISLRPVVIALFAVGLILLFMQNIPRQVGGRVVVLGFALAFGVVGAVGWRLDSWRPWAGRWFVIVSLAALVCLSAWRLNVPVLLTLLAIPAALSAALIGLPAALAVAVGATLLAVSQVLLVHEGDLPVLASALSVTWGVTAVMAAVYRPMVHVARWAWEYYLSAQSLLNESLDRQVTLKQAIDDLAQANLQLTRLNLVAQGLRQAAEDARSAKEQFVANVSHELRTPLNMILGFSEMIVESPETYGKLPPAVLSDLDVIHRNAEHLSALIDDVLDLSQVEAGEMALTREDVPLETVIDAAMTAVRPLFDSKGLYLRKAMPEGGCSVFCDRTRIREVLLNLLSNAGRFTERGGVDIHVQPRDGEIVVSVVDTGPGIAAQDQSELFQPFHQVDGSIRRRYGGTGLGLSISKRFIELHGGRIWVDSKEGVGTTFHFSLPAEQPTGEGFARWLTPDWEYVQRTRPWQAPRPVVRPCFVVLDSGGALQRLLVRYLDDVDILPVADLEQALDELSRVPARALLINESSVSRTLEDLGVYAALPNDVPVIVCSVPGAAESSTANGVSDRLVKPISRAALFEVLESLGVTEGTVLIVDDEPDALQLFGRMLSRAEHDYQVLLARDGEEAMRVLEQYRPDVILLDLVMPNMDGFQFLEKHRGDAAWAEIPVVVVSARDPAGQPIVSSALAVTRGGGLSVHQLLTGIEALSGALSSTAPVFDPTLPGTGRD